jgi:hypothetical protein
MKMNAFQMGNFSNASKGFNRGLKQKGLAVGLAYATEHMPGDVQYLTGYDPHIENVALLVLPNHLVLLGGAEGEKMFEDMGRVACGAISRFLRFHSRIMEGYGPHACRNSA